MFLGCWHVVLAQWLRVALRDALAAIDSPVVKEVTADPHGRVVITHMAELAQHGLWGTPGADLARWYHDTLPNALPPKVAGGEFDADASLPDTLEV